MEEYGRDNMSVGLRGFKNSNMLIFGYELEDNSDSFSSLHHISSDLSTLIAVLQRDPREQMHEISCDLCGMFLLDLDQIFG